MGAPIPPVPVQESRKCLLPCDYRPDDDALQSEAARVDDRDIRPGAHLHDVQRGVRRLLALQVGPRTEQSRFAATQPRDSEVRKVPVGRHQGRRYD